MICPWVFSTATSPLLMTMLSGQSSEMTISPVGPATTSWWSRAYSGKRPHRDPAPDYGHDDSNLRSGYHHVRTLLERATWALRPRARRELRRELGPLDKRIIARTVNDPFAPRDLPWWKRRIEI